MYIGCDAPLLGDRIPGSSNYHGTDGLGDVPDANAPGLDKLQKEHAVTTLLRLSKENAGLLRF